MNRLDGLVGYHLRRAQLRAFAAFGAAVGELGLTPLLYGILATIEAHPGATQTDVATALGADASTLVRRLDRLERDGLVRRTPSPHDRRTTIPVLTPAGRDVLERATPAVHQSERMFLAALEPGERDALRAALERISAPESR